MVELSLELQRQWHPTKNLPLTIETVTSIKQDVWWVGECNHSWNNTIQNRIAGSNCLYCAGKRILIGFNDLASQRPNLVKEWHPTRNLPLTPGQVTVKSSSKNVWWLDEQGHEWAQKPLHRSNGVGCAYCAGKKILSGFNDLATTHPTLAQEWHPSKNLPMTAEHISRGNSKLVWWLCPNNHPYQLRTSDRVSKGMGCHFCSGKKVFEGFNDLQTINPQLAAEWHPTLNKNITPNQVTSISSRKAAWVCSRGHEYIASIHRRNTGTGCSTCAGNTILAGFNDLAFKNPGLAAEWHPIKNGELLPSQVTASTAKKVWWLGTECGHEWEAQVCNRANGAGCSVCAGKIVLPGFNDLASQRPDLAAEWHPTLNGDLLPTDIGPTSGRYRIWWQCLVNVDHIWQVRPNNRRDGSGCPECDSKRYVSKPDRRFMTFWLG